MVDPALSLVASCNTFEIVILVTTLIFNLDLGLEEAIDS